MIEMRRQIRVLARRDQTALRVLHDHRIVLSRFRMDFNAGRVIEAGVSTRTIEADGRSLLWAAAVFGTSIDRRPAPGDATRDHAWHSDCAKDGVGGGADAFWFAFGGLRGGCSWVGGHGRYFEVGGLWYVAV